MTRRTTVQQRVDDEADYTQLGLARSFVGGMQWQRLGHRSPLSNLPSASSKVLVLDDQGRGVVDAAVEIVGGAGRALTSRSGRGDLFVSPQGNQLVRVNGSAAAATAGDQLGSLVVSVPTDGGDFPFPFYLPDVQASSGGLITVGTQTADTTIDDAATSGIRLTIPNGSSVGLVSGAVTVTMRTGSLQPQHLAGTLPGGLLFGRGIYLDPPKLDPVCQGPRWMWSMTSRWVALRPFSCIWTPTREFGAPSIPAS